MNPNLDLDISDADLERMEAEAQKKQPKQAEQDLVLGDEELVLPEIGC